MTDESFAQLIEALKVNTTFTGVELHGAPIISYVSLLY